MSQKLLLSILVLLSLVLTGYGQDTFADDFQSGTYTSNTGSMNFNTGWTESGSGEITNPNAGRIQIVSGQLQFQNMDGARIERSLDLSTALSATVSFNYTRVGGNEFVAFQLHNGTSFTTVQTLSLSTNVSYTLNGSQLTANSGIRFISASGGWSSWERARIDNIEFTVQYPDQPPVVLATGNQNFCTGSSIPIAQTISITDPDDTSTSAVYVQISNGYINGEDLLTLTGTHPNITSSWDVVQGELTLQGPATYTEFEAAVLATQFSSSSPNPSGNRQFSITVGEANFLPATQHYYEFVSDPGISWTDAEAAAAARTYFGLQGYLVTLTSQEEADFSGSQASGFGWIGATDLAVEGEWRWVTGPEAGTQFWQGLANGTELTFANWNGGEPNNVGGGGEDYAHIAAASVIRGGAPIGAWNDLPNRGGGGAYASQGYVVEYGGMPGDPVLNISATTGLSISSCTVITNRRITYRVNNN